MPNWDTYWRQLTRRLVNFIIPICRYRYLYVPVGTSITHVAIKIELV